MNLSERIDKLVKLNVFELNGDMISLNPKVMREITERANDLLDMPEFKGEYKKEATLFRAIADTTVAYMGEGLAEREVAEFTLIIITTVLKLTSFSQSNDVNFETMMEYIEVASKK